MLDGSAKSDVETPDMIVTTEGTAVTMDSRTEWEEGKKFKDMQKEMMELLCNETVCYELCFYHVKKRKLVKVYVKTQTSPSVSLLLPIQDFLMEAKVLKLLAPLVTEEQTDVKLGSLLYVSPQSSALNH